MHFLNTLIALALASLAYAQSKTLYFLGQPSVVKVGQPVVVKYAAPAMSEPVRIVLRKGQASNLDTVATLTGSALGGTYTWTPSRALRPGDDYALEIMQGHDINYTKQFTISGTSPSLVSSAEDTKSASAHSTRPTALIATVPKNHVTIKAITTASASTIPMSRNTTFVSPTLKPTTPGNQTPSPTLGGGTSAPSPTGNAAAALGGQLHLVVGAAAVALAYLC